MQKLKYLTILGASCLMLLLGANQSFGAKPPSPGTIKLQSAPLLTNKVECSVLNVGQTAMLPVEGVCLWEQLDNGSLDILGCQPQGSDPAKLLDPGHATGYGFPGASSVTSYNDGLIHRVYCEVEYFGLPGDLLGAFCGDLGCVPLQ